MDTLLKPLVNCVFYGACFKIWNPRLKPWAMSNYLIKNYNWFLVNKLILTDAYWNNKSFFKTSYSAFNRWFLMVENTTASVFPVKNFACEVVNIFSAKSSEFLSFQVEGSHLPVVFSTIYTKCNSFLFMSQRFNGFHLNGFHGRNQSCDQSHHQ